MTSYQKLKQQVATLYADIRTLVLEDSNTLKHAETKAKYLCLFNKEQLLLYGQPTISKHGDSHLDMPVLDVTKLRGMFEQMYSNGYDFCFYCGAWDKREELDYTYVGGKCKECKDK